MSQALAWPPALRKLTFRHALSGAMKQVDYLGMAGVPLRAQIHWPIAGDYLVSPRSGTIVGDRKNAEALRHWQISGADGVFLKEEYRRVRAQAQEPEQKLAKCR